MVVARPVDNDDGSITFQTDDGAELTVPVTETETLNPYQHT